MIDRYKIENITDKIKKIILKDKLSYEKELGLIAVLCDINYSYNQKYADHDIENYLIKTKKRILTHELYKPNKKTVLFYDSFGLDLRGWAASYVRALTKLGYYIVYVTNSRAKGNIPHIIKEMDEDNSTVIYFNVNHSYINIAKEIDAIFKKFKPCTAFFYTTPNDVSATLAFSNNDSSVRVQIDLTDHAFWLGCCAFDYILESREMGASIAKYHRGVATEKIRKLDCTPYINRDRCDKPLPFDIEKEKYVFTGGALYKTLGDKELLFYRTIDHILSKFEDVKFLYAGAGDKTEMKKIIDKYPGRAFLIAERPDFYRIIENCILYLNSYPMFGGLMMRFAALSNTIPITLKHGNDSDGLLVNQDKLGIEFEDYNDFINEIDLLLTDKQYRSRKEKMVSGSVMDEESFRENLRCLIEEQKTLFEFKYIEKYDTKKFRKEYARRYSYSEICKTIATRKNLVLSIYFPKEYLLGAFYKIKEKILG